MDGARHRVGGYEIGAVLARGGMGVVYLAWQRALEREVVLKRLDLDSTDPAVARRFVREAHVAAALDHPNVVTVFDFHEDGGVPYIAMEYVPGGSLRPLMHDLTLPQVFGVLEGVLAALEHAGGRGIVHRDLKPANVLVTAGGGVKIADFGIARAFQEVSSSLTATGSAVGTPAYMAPEQALNEPLGPYTDLYAVGVMTFEMLAGRPPFEPADPPVAVLYRHVHEPVPPLLDHAPGTPPALASWVEWLLAKAPRDRPRSAGEAWRALEEVAVAELGPYWRREARLRTSAGAAPEEAATSPQPGVTPPPEAGPAAATTAAAPDIAEPRSAAAAARAPARPRRRRLAALAGAGALAIVGVALLAVTSGRGPGAAGAATPYDFDGDGRQEVAVGLPRWSVAGAAGGGVALLGDRGPPVLLTAPGAGIPGEPRLLDDFGTAVASGDFDGDRLADIAIGAPGTNVGDGSRSEGVVAVLYGDGNGFAGDRRQTLDGSAMSRRYRNARYGASLATADLDGDGYHDLVVGAPGADLGSRGGSGAVHVVAGSERGLTPGAARILRRPAATLEEFGSRVSLGDVDGDGDVDVAEGARARAAGMTGHATWCPGSPDGPRRCRVLDASRSVVTLAVADLDGDGRAEVVEGDPVPSARYGKPAPGLVRVHRGGPDGPAAPMATLRLPRRSRPGDAFGAALAVARFDGDRHEDLAIAAPGLVNRDGHVVVVPGGPDGLAVDAARSYDLSRAKSRRATTAGGLSAVDVDGDGAVDLAAAVTGRSGPYVGIQVLLGGGDRLVPGRVLTIGEVEPPPGLGPRNAEVRLGSAGPR